MTSTPATSLPNAATAPRAVSRPGWVWIAVIAALFICLHGDFLWRTVRIATNAPSPSVAAVLKNLLSGSLNQDWSHSLVIPFIAIYYVYQRRADLARAPRRLCWPGLAVFFLGLISYAWWISPGRNDMLQGYSMIVALFGLVLFMLGPAVMRIAWFPIVYLVFAVKVSDRLWDEIAFRLQILAAHGATVALKFLTIDASVEGSTINISRGVNAVKHLNVAEACAGLRMLMAFMAMGVAVAFLVKRAWWQRLVLVLMTVPIAVAVNVARVTVMGLLVIVNDQLAAGDVHKFIGLLMLIPALGLFLLLGWVLDHLLIQDEPAGGAKPAAAPAPAEPAAAPARPAWIAQGAAFGVFFSLLVGLAYLLLFASVRPGFLGDWLTRPVATALLAVAAAALGAGVWGARRISAPHGPGQERRPQAFGLAFGAGALACGVIGLNGILWANGVVRHRETVEVRRPLFQIPSKMGSWSKVGEDRRISAEEEEELGTRQHIMRVYRDNSLPEGTPGSEVNLHVAYYTGTPDTVPHVPERCFVAGGLQNRGVNRVPMKLEGSQYTRGLTGAYTARSYLHNGSVTIPAIEFDATRFTFGLRGNHQANVFYFFAANGRFLATPDLVRLQGFDPRDRYSYYCKIEVGTLDVEDPQAALLRAQAFLAAALPEIMACLPDWDDVTQGRWPVRSAAGVPAATTPRGTRE